MRSRCPSLLAASLVLAGCDFDPNHHGESSAEESRSDGIVRGTVHAGDPAVVLLQLGQAGTCSGTLISPTVVLTAQHCLRPVSPGEVTVRFVNRADENGLAVGVTEFSSPAFFDGGEIDLGLVRMAQPVNNISPAEWRLPPAVNWEDPALRDQLPGLGIRLVGFGLSGTGAGDSGIKRLGRTRLTQAARLEFATSTEGTSATCNGDSGGPNFATINAGGVTAEYLIGVTVRGTGARCGEGLDIATATNSSEIVSLINGFLAGGGGDDGFPDDGFPDDGFPDDRFPDDGFPDDGFPDDGFPDDGFPDDGFPSDDFPGDFPGEDGGDFNGPGQGVNAAATDEEAGSGGCSTTGGDSGLVLPLLLLGALWWCRQRGSQNSDPNDTGTSRRCSPSESTSSSAVSGATIRAQPAPCSTN